MDSLIWADFEELERESLYELLQLRSDVFVVEQRSIFQDIDGHDRGARHLMLRRNLGIAGYLRLQGPGPVPSIIPHKSPGEASISRVVLRKDARGQRLGRTLIAAAIGEARRLYGLVPIRLSAQCEQEAFYRNQGFIRLSDMPYDDGGIAHVEMVFGPQGTAP